MPVSRTKERTKSTTDIDLDFLNPQNHPLTTSKDNTNSISSEDEFLSNKSKTAPTIRTDTKTRAMAQNSMRDLMNIVNDYDTPTPNKTGQPEPNTKNALTVKDTSLWNNKNNRVTPNFKMPKYTTVDQLPGTVQRGIRKLGQDLFNSFNGASLDQIKVWSTFTNDKEDMSMVSQYVRAKGIRDDDANIDFSNVIPGYNAKVSIWNTDKNTFMFVKDKMGEYVYSWPGGRGTQLNNTSIKNLK
jgi:hypothetical protein